MLLFGVLGPVEAWRDATELPLRGGRQRALLAALAVDAGSVVPADVLAERVWGERPPANAANALQQQVLKLRRALGAPAIAFAPPGYRLAAEPDALDATRFERLVAEARGRADERPVAAIALLDEALALWRGPAFADLAYEDWAAGEAARLEELRLQAEELRVEALLRSGRCGDAIHALERLVRARPLREHLHALKMLALYRDGRQGEALSAYMAARATLVEQLGVEPGLELRDLHERILDQDPALDRPERERARAPAAALIGREAELAELRRLLLDERARLVTLTGPAGVGKTSLAHALVDVVAAAGESAPVFVELAAVRDPGSTLVAIAGALDAAEADTPQSLAAALADRRRILVLDNLEHLTASAPAIAELLEAAPPLQLLTTSRIALRVDQEVVVPVGPLTLPEAGVALMPAELTAASTAARLFATRAHAANASFELTSANAPVVAGVCRALDGLPLALELAAARLRHLSIGELEQRIEQRLALLTRGGPDAPARHRSLRAAIDVSQELLEPAAKAVFARFGAFVGGATLEAVEAVCGDNVAAVDGLAALIDASLVGRREVRGRSRYETLATIGEYAREQLARSDDAQTVYERLTAHLLAVAEGATAGRLYTIDPPVLAALADEHANFVAAIVRAAAAGDGVTVLRFVTALGQHWHRHGHRREGVQWIREGLTLAPEAPAWLRARALAYDGALRSELPDAGGDAHVTLLEALELAEDAGDVRAELTAAGGLGMTDDDLDASTAWLERVLAIARRSGDRPLVAFALSDLAYSDLLAGRWELACQRCEEALELARELDVPAVHAAASLNLSGALLERDRPAEATARAREALTFALRATEHEMTAYALGTLAAGLCRLGEDELAARLAGAADALLERLGIGLQPLERRHREQTVAALRHRLGEGARPNGRPPSPEEALELVAAWERRGRV